MATAPQDVELTDDQKRQLADAANEMGKPWSEVFKEALVSYRSRFGRPKSNDREGPLSLYEALGRDGLIGIAKDTPSDLSTNPKYLE